MTQPEEKKSSGLEWTIHDGESMRAALKGMMAKRGLTQEGLAARVGTASLYGSFLSGKQDKLRSDTLFKAANAMGFEITISEPKTGRTKRRLALLKAEAVRLKAEKAAQIAEELAAEAAKLASGNDDDIVGGDGESNDPDARDENGHLRRELTAEEIAEVDRVLDKYGQIGR